MSRQRLGNLGKALREVGRFEEAITVCQDAAIYHETGDRHGEAMALSNLGLALHSAGQFDNAITAWQEAASTFRETGDHHREGSALRALEAVRSAPQTNEPDAADDGQSGDLCKRRQQGLAPHD